MRIAIPNKGRLHTPALGLLERAGLHVVDGADRKLYADTVDPDVSVLYARAADIPKYVADGAAECGVTGLDQIRESESALEPLLDLEFGRCRLVLAAPEGGAIESVSDLEGGTIATEFPTVTAEFLADHDVSAEITEVSGATELTPHVDIADAIVDITSTGTTLHMNRLEILAEVMSSSVHLVATDRTRTLPKVTQVQTAMDSVIAAEGKRYLMMNVPAGRLPAVEAVIPGLGGPTVMDIDGQDAQAVHVVVDERAVFETISRLKEVGAEDILVTEIERLVE
jgi:ATP phosphoribosyltransferase